MRHVFAGIDLAAGRGRTEVALLELADDCIQPRYFPHQHRQTITDEEIVAVLAEADPAVVAIDAPLSLPAAVTAAVRGDGTTTATPLPPRSVGATTVPRTVSGGRPQVAPTHSPYTRQAERDPMWSTMGVRPLPVSFLGGLTFRALVLAPKLRSALPRAAIIEVFPTATLRLLGIRLAERGAKREAKTSEAARRDTQRGLAGVVTGIPSVDDELLSTDLLDALAAALTGVAYFRGEYVVAGDVDEGQIILPSLGFVSSLSASH